LQHVAILERQRLVLPGQGPPEGDELLELLGVLGGQIAAFRGIAVGIE
jgi:hypothetical protein